MKMNAQETMNEILDGFDELGNVEDQSDSSEDDATIPDPRDEHTAQVDEELPDLQPQDHSGITNGMDGEEWRSLPIT